MRKTYHLRSDRQDTWRALETEADDIPVGGKVRDSLQFIGLLNLTNQLVEINLFVKFMEILVHFNIQIIISKVIIW